MEEHPCFFKVPLILVGAVLALASVTSAQASISDLAREKSWASQIVDTLIAGEAVWLEANQIKFLGLYVRAEKAPPSAAGVILIHGRGVHPAWGFIDNLRLDLADRGWHTLSLQMPILKTDAKLAQYGKTFPEAFDRLDAGVRFLKRKGVSSVILIGHSTGAMTAVAYAVERRPKAIAGIVAIGLSTDPSGAKYMRPSAMLEQLTLPVLDLFGADDLPEVLDYNAARAAAAEKIGSAYTQHQEKGANHFFTDRYEQLRKRIVDWLAARR